MAINKTINYKGFVIQDSYCRISSANCNKEQGISFQIDVYYNYEARINPQNVIVSFNYVKPFDLNSNVNIFAECYEYLKTNIPDWTDSIDC
jgi:hypothetical protein